jgi:CDP-diacylglycerol--glycerol-3-phosphate 3-phosphatidyltransferase
MSLPNSLTLLRIFFVPVLVVLLVTKEPSMDVWALGVFLSAALTDLLDGYLARRRGQVSRTGILLDPIADKLLTSAAFISLVELHRIAAWIVVIIVGREFAISGLRAMASAEGFTMAASELGKTKMVSQVAAISVLLLEGRYPRLHMLGQVLLWLVVWFALASAAQYTWQYLRKLEARAQQASSGRVVVIRGNEGQDKKDAAAQ